MIAIDEFYVPHDDLYVGLSLLNAAITSQFCMFWYQ